MRKRLLIPIALLGVLTACGGTEPAATPSPSGPKAGADCEELVADGRQAHFGGDISADLYGVVYGTGRTGVVIAHMNGGNACQGTPYGKELAAAGYRVLILEFAGFGASTAAGATKAQQIAAAAAYLRSDGATAVALIGGSMGGTASLIAATQITPPVKAVVSLSAPTTFGGDDALSAVAKLAVPVFYSAGEYESSFVDNAKELFAATPKTVERKLVLGAATASHGLWLTDPAVGVADLRSQIAAFLKHHAPAA